MGFRTFDMLNKATKEGIEDKPRGRFRTKDIDIDNIYSNANNFYPQDGIEEKSGEILAVGLLENLVVKYNPCDKGEYELISGERRWRACKKLVEAGHEEFKVVTCNIRSATTEDAEKVELIIANSARIKSDAVVLREEKELKEALERMKKSGTELRGYDLSTGRLRDVIAQMLNRSTSKIAQIEAINNNLTAELLQEIEKGNLGFSAAYELSKKPQEEQQAIYKKAKETGEEITYIKAKEIEEKVLDSNTKEEFEPEPEKVESICYGCLKWNECNEKSDTVKKCNEYVNKKETEKTEEQRYNEEQDKLDRESKEKLKEIAEEEKMNNLPSDKTEEIYRYRVGSTTYKEISTKERRFDVRKNEKAYKKGEIVEMLEFSNGEHTGNTIKATITYVLEDCQGLCDGYCIIGFEIIEK